MGKERVNVWLLDIENLEVFNTHGGLGASTYANCFLKWENKLSSRHFSLVTLAVL